MPLVSFVFFPPGPGRTAWSGKGSMCAGVYLCVSSSAWSGTYSASTGCKRLESSMARPGALGRPPARSDKPQGALEVYLAGYVIATATAAMRAIKPFNSRPNGRPCQRRPSLTFFYPTRPRLLLLEI